MKRNIVLVGFMGAGKTVVAQELSGILKWDLVSTDLLIEQKEGRPITQIFSDSGEPYFRKVESAIVRELSARQGLVIDCGGGVVLSDNNIIDLKKSGVIFYLSATPDVIYKRIKDQTHRPLLNVSHPEAEIKKLLQAREPRYQKADHVIDTCAKTPRQVAEEIMRLASDD
ncbi:MAG TPA: shikimate kinase [Candidatus Omnitrophota bacterium]|nr:shikimate kinase [Candidatus Omnitrophota bacterium]HPD84970.1 shikimate kinase [Candidatus Omnitrophota bacterium]HRZ03828.1 shikimate kinase [Candidatus Omnitrophota bacterium]